MKNKVWNYILGGFLILFGLSFIVCAEKTFGTIVLVAGSVLITFSVLKLILSLRNSIMSSLFMGSSIIGIIFGIILVTNTEESIKIVTFLLGIWLLFSGISYLTINKINNNKIGFYKAIIKIIIGLTAFIVPEVTTNAIGYFIGAILIISGITMFINLKDKEEKVVYKVKVKK